MARWWVVSPEYEIGGYYEPPELVRDAVAVEAKTKRDALILGVRELLKNRKSWPSTNRLDGQPPWAGMKVEADDEATNLATEED